MDSVIASVTITKNFSLPDERDALNTFLDCACPPEYVPDEAKNEGTPAVGMHATATAAKTPSHPGPVHVAAGPRK